MRGRDHTSVDHYAGMARVGAWPATQRQVALQNLKAHGFPSSRSEDWKYTSTKRWLREPFERASGLAEQVQAELPQGDRVVYVDGVFHPGLSRLSEGLSVLDEGASEEPLLGTCLTEPLGFQAVNSASWRQVNVVRGGGRVHLVHVRTGAKRLSVLRHLIHAQAGQALEVVEHYLGEGEGEGLVNVVTEVVVGPGATLTHVMLQEEGEGSFHIHHVSARVGAEGRLNSTSVLLGGGASRVELDVVLEGEQAEVSLHGLTLGRRRQLSDHHVTIDHAVPNCVSKQVFRSILDDQATSVFTGKVIVRLDAQGTDSAQANHNLLLSDDAVAKTRPQLEIYADDVACVHGATVGKLDEDALFYLQQRGLAPDQARALLTVAFAKGVLDAVPEAVRGPVSAKVEAWLEGAR